MLANSNARKKKLVQEAVFALREMDAERTSFLQTEVSSTQDFTDQMKEQWTIYMEDTENNYREDSTTVESEKMAIEEGLQECKSMTTSGLQQWETAQSSLLTLGQNNKSSMESLLKSGIEANELIHCRSSASMNTAIEDLDIEHNGLLSCIDSKFLYPPTVSSCQTFSNSLFTFSKCRFTEA
ncbi:125 kDa kinesin-related protein [Dendrobium catenatum]|uniref:125 kDa kinesin-related protein n=1 Tax=Dendrobium catenatum TaxID=906689 RepID=A0A2I0VGQ1_9ASPA|nr:125 kDa kinesin-related protein [Dendrobium catenatum]